MKQVKEKLPRDIIEWTTRDGTSILLKRMEHSHLQNTILLLTKKKVECEALNLGTYTVNDRSASEWIEIFRAELAFRNPTKQVEQPVALPGLTMEPFTITL